MLVQRKSTITNTPAGKVFKLDADALAVREAKKQLAILLWRCAAIVTPEKPSLGALAKVLGVHPVTPSYWLMHGHLPVAPLKKIENMFGEALKNPSPFSIDAQWRVLTTKKTR